MNKTKTHSVTIYGISKATKNKLKEQAISHHRNIPVSSAINYECLKAIDFYLEQQLKAKTAKA